MKQLTLTSPAFQEGDWIPLENSARGADYSPELQIHGIEKGAVSMVITLDDSSHPFLPDYNHWIIWNVPITELIPAGIPKGKIVETLGGAVQGIAYGKHCYKGPKPPFKSIHTYVFTVFVLDCSLELSENSSRAEVRRAMESHILQKACLSGRFQSHRIEE